MVGVIRLELLDLLVAGVLALLVQRLVLRKNPPLERVLLEPAPHGGGGDRAGDDLAGQLRVDQRDSGTPLSAGS
ncbi:hypothetical protein OG985_46880 [Streptomyces sp. NBC_00289]|uniref:hypothetical protein n=1 Tax=Streptomyces sp. NBC_00289 TaxID=2975703 RepID=UPI0032541B0B